jgi:SAM-dependent methyltransferase
VIRREILRHQRLTRVLRRVRRSVRRFEGRTRPPTPVAVRDYPSTFRISPPPAPVGDAWPEPPAIDLPFAAADPAAGPPPVAAHFDIELFERLQAEYADHPIAPTAPHYDPASLTERSRRRLVGIHDHIGLAGRTVLEVGCGAGYEVWFLARHFGSDAWGIDISPRNAWPALRGDRVHLVEGDIAIRGSLPEATFDRAISFTVWEHITQPIAAITELARVMKPGGLAWIRANLYRGPTASHRTRDIAFPFPHLLFGDDVIAEGLRRAGRPALGAAWVNRLTWEQYESAFIAAGFAIRSLAFTRYPLDEAFYRRFEDVLGRYPRVDLERGFFQVVLERLPAPAG